jgi:uncharacterized protein (DUF488 family)
VQTKSDHGYRQSARASGPLACLSLVVWHRITQLSYTQSVLEPRTLSCAPSTDRHDAKTQQECVFTVGHSNVSAEAFFRLLGRYGIEVLIDTRSVPRSLHAPQFDRESLAASAPDHEISYRFHGDKLGGRPASPQFYDDDGYVLYGRVARSEPFRETLAELRPIWQEFRLAFLCTEENPIACHRRLLIGRVLYDSGIELRHLRGTGTFETEDKLRNAAVRSGQSPLFSDTEDSWKSVRSVLRKKPPKNSLKR